jgi:hypothetical protein
LTNHQFFFSIEANVIPARAGTLRVEKPIGQVFDIRKTKEGIEQPISRGYVGLPW